jgi:hypothetical protein
MLEEMEFYDNNTELGYKECISILKKYFVRELPDFKPEREYYDPKGYWGIFFVSGPVEIFLGYERSFLNYDLKISGVSTNLLKNDTRINKLERTSERNFFFLIDVIKKYLRENTQ